MRNKILWCRNWCGGIVFVEFVFYMEEVCIDNFVVLIFKLFDFVNLYSSRFE